MITLAHKEEWPVRGVLKRSPYCTACRPPTSKDRKCRDSAEFVVGARAFSAELGKSLNATGPASLHTSSYAPSTSVISEQTIALYQQNPDLLYRQRLLTAERHVVACRARAAVSHC